MAYSSTRAIALWYDSVRLILGTVLELWAAVSQEIRAPGTKSNKAEEEAGGLVVSQFITLDNARCVGTNALGIKDSTLQYITPLLQVNWHHRRFAVGGASSRRACSTPPIWPCFWCDSARQGTVPAPSSRRKGCRMLHIAPHIALSCDLRHNTGNVASVMLRTDGEKQWASFPGSVIPKASGMLCSRADLCYTRSARKDQRS
jgi:hypothetical protein